MKPEKKLKKKDERSLINNQQPKLNAKDIEIVEPFKNATDSLMPELEELVKKNPNRLIGCGG